MYAAFFGRDLVKILSCGVWDYPHMEGMFWKGSGGESPCPPAGGKKNTGDKHELHAEKHFERIYPQVYNSRKRAQNEE